MKLQYFGFWKQTRKKTYQKDFKAFALHCIGWVGGGAQFKLLYKLVLALRTYNELQKLARKWTCKVCILPPPNTHRRCIEDCRSDCGGRAEQRRRRTVRLSRQTAAIFQRRSEILSFCGHGKKRLAPFKRQASHASSADIPTLCRTESCSIL